MGKPPSQWIFSDDLLLPAVCTENKQHKIQETRCIVAILDMTGVYDSWGCIVTSPSKEFSQARTFLQMVLGAPKSMRRT